MTIKVGFIVAGVRVRVRRVDGINGFDETEVERSRCGASREREVGVVQSSCGNSWNGSRKNRKGKCVRARKRVLPHGWV